MKYLFMYLGLYVRYFPQQLCKGIFPSDNFPNVTFPKRQLPKFVLAEALACSSRIVRPPIPF